MLPDRVSNPGPLTYESGALPIALRGPAHPLPESQILKEYALPIRRMFYVQNMSQCVNFEV